MKLQIPKKETHWQTYKDKDGIIRQIVTSNADRSKYYLYNVKEDGSLTKIETAASPVFDKCIVNDW